MSGYSMRTIHLCAMGDGGVGKTAITIMLCSNHFVEYYDPTIEDSYRKQMVVDDSCYMLEILDTAGQEDFSPLRHGWIRSSQGFLLIYSITSRSSFDQLAAFKKDIDRTKDFEDTPLIIVANKCDLESERKVSTAEGKALAAEWGCLFAETSAKTRLGVQDAFSDLVRSVVSHYGLETKKSVSRRNRDAKPMCTVL